MSFVCIQCVCMYVCTYFLSVDLLVYALMFIILPSSLSSFVGGLLLFTHCFSFTIFSSGSFCPMFKIVSVRDTFSEEDDVENAQTMDTKQNPRGGD